MNVSNVLDDGDVFHAFQLSIYQEDVEDMGGTMRLGLYAARLAEGSLARDLYGRS